MKVAALMPDGTKMWFSGNTQFNSYPTGKPWQGEVQFQITAKEPESDEEILDGVWRGINAAIEEIEEFGLDDHHPYAPVHDALGKVELLLADISKKQAQLKKEKENV
jgi:hypothetical protein